MLIHVIYQQTNRTSGTFWLPAVNTEIISWGFPDDLISQIWCTLMSNIAVANRNTLFFDRTKLFYEWVQMDDFLLPGVGWKVWALSRNIFNNPVEAEKLRPLGKWCYLHSGIFGPRLVHSFCLRRTPAFRPSLNCPAKEPPATEESAAASEVLPAAASTRVWREMLLATVPFFNAALTCPYRPTDLQQLITRVFVYGW